MHCFSSDQEFVCECLAVWLGMQKLLPRSEGYVCYSDAYRVWGSPSGTWGLHETWLWSTRCCLWWWRVGLVACSFYQDMREQPVLDILGYQWHPHTPWHPAWMGLLWTLLGTVAGDGVSFCCRPRCHWAIGGEMDHKSLLWESWTRWLLGTQNFYQLSNSWRTCYCTCASILISALLFLLMSHIWGWVLEAAISFNINFV